MEGGDLIQAAVLMVTGGGLVKLVDSLQAWRKGRHQEEQDAWTQRDREAKARRKLEEYAHILRSMLLRRGATKDELPPWPEY
ncbi:hypothetical protein D9V41_14710 [Aeromicrobium phragmitis]|uniref:Uncharacterized protein n=1 Tax=Aeromicrobium phragmitis TaxID=2478914 RepID=A0A3L8PJS7_9ACTN|nr:hypothetical protein [Aeromicrobium phragmitis]RLV54838.1 hypothetical protein D9V41_14710 [Aeromicrobium phragmitis]